MKHTIFFLNMLVACLALSGCQKTDDKTENVLISNNQENEEKGTIENEQGVQDGDKISFSLTDGVTLDAVVEMPDINFKEVGRYQVIAQKYEGKNLIPALLGSMPENIEVEDRGKEGYGYRYKGDLGENWKNLNGLAMADEDAYIETEHWNEIFGYFPISYIGNEIQIVFDSEMKDQEFEFATLKEASSEVGQYLKEVTGFEDVNMYRAYSFDWQQMKKMQENMINATEEEQAKPEGEFVRDWKTEDNCYWMFFEQILDGIPVLSNSVSRQDDLYIPASVTEVGYTQNGMEYIRFGRCYEILNEQKVELVSVQDIYETLRKKFEMAIVTDVTIDQMKLIYYPLPTKKNEEERWVCDMIPTWQFRVREGEYTDYIYISAVDNMEFVG